MVPRLVMLSLLVLLLAACHEKKQLAAARANAIGYGLARCECEKLAKKDPPGDTTLCSQQMAQAERYLKINFEVGKFSETEKQAILKIGDDTLQKCLKE